MNIKNEIKGNKFRRTNYSKPGTMEFTDTFL